MHSSTCRSAALAVLSVFLAAPVSRGAAAADSAAIVPFRIHVSDEVLTDLKQRLARARFADEIPDSNWDYGTNAAYLKELITYWRDTYDWRKHERRLNEFDQFKTTIDGVEIHFIHQRSKNPHATPLLLLNGWPSSIVEYTKVIGPLTDPAAFGGKAEDSFHVVIPSMPGFGFSGKQQERGYDALRIVKMWAVLMARLGYTRYGVHGTDWGHWMTRIIGPVDGAHLIGIHRQYEPTAPTPAPPPLTGKNRLVDVAHWNGYQAIQSSKPQTLGQGLADSPVALASWITEKWFNWIDHDGDMEKVVSRDDLLTNIMIYWVTNSGASSARIYFENRHPNGVMATSGFPTPPPDKSGVPVSRFITAPKYEQRAFGRTPTAQKDRADNPDFARTTYLAHGAHFPAIEAPDLLVADLRDFFRDRH